MSSKQAKGRKGKGGEASVKVVRNTSLRKCGWSIGVRNVMCGCHEKSMKDEMETVKIPGVGYAW